MIPKTSKVQSFGDLQSMGFLSTRTVVLVESGRVCFYCVFPTVGGFED